MANITVVPGTGSRRRYYPKYRVQLGPFSGGINSVKKANHLNPNELQDCLNYIVRPDGTLGMRPRAQAFDTTSFNLGVFNPLLNSAGQPASSRYTLLNDNSFALPGIAVVATQDSNGNNRFFVYQNGAFTQTFNGWTFNGPPAASTGIVYYIANSTIYLAVNGRIYQSSGFGVTPTLISASPALNNPEAVYIIKDRLFVVDSGIPNKIFWSKATDFTTWAAPDGGVLNVEAFLLDSFVLNDSLYITTGDGIWRLSFNSDPAVDGVFQRVYTSEQPIYNATVVNNEIYFITNLGLFKLVNGFAIELSTNIKNLFQKCMMRNRSTWGMSFLHKMGNLLLIGPFFNNQDTLYDLLSLEAAVTNNDYSGEYYLVFNLSTGVWTTWKFGAGYAWDGASGGGGSSGPVVNGKHKSNIFFDNGNFIYVGATKYPGAQVFFMSAAELNDYQVTNALDISKDATNTTRSPYMGFKFKTGLTDLGDLGVWKRIFRVILTAISGTATVTTGPGNNPPSPRNLLLVEKSTDVVTSAAQLTTITDNNLHFAASFRGRAFGFEHDAVSMTVTAGTPLYTEVQKIEFAVSLGQPVST